MNSDSILCERGKTVVFVSLNSFPVLTVVHLRVADAETNVTACPCLGQRSPWNGFNFVHSAALTGQASGSK